jgi:hypothetical protein
MSAKIKRNVAAKAKSGTSDAPLNLRGSHLYLGDELIPDDCDITMKANRLAAHLAIAYVEGSRKAPALPKFSEILRNEDGRIIGMVTVEKN